MAEALRFATARVHGQGFAACLLMSSRMIDEDGDQLAAPSAPAGRYVAADQRVFE